MIPSSAQLRANFAKLRVGLDYFTNARTDGCRDAPANTQYDTSEINYRLFMTILDPIWCPATPAYFGSAGQISPNIRLGQSYRHRFAGWREIAAVTRVGINSMDLTLPDALRPLAGNSRISPKGDFNTRLPRRMPHRTSDNFTYFRLRPDQVRATH
jgi:hypothetical protein